jgi:tRNA(fMet)-specific endonuclease VapC
MKNARSGDAAAKEAGALRHSLESSGTVIGPHDWQIAAIARKRGWNLVTANLAEFRCVPSLKIEDWTGLVR